jgi:cytochrome b6-f complex iron-sulfur subunit
MAKLTTAEILARARQQDSGAAGNAGKPAVATPAEEPSPPATESAAEPRASTAKPPAASTPASPGPRPSSTGDILARARAQAAAAGDGGAAKTPPAAKPGASSAPKSTKDAARAQATGEPAATTARAEPAAKPAAKAPAKPSPAAAAGGARPSVQEMLKKARAEKPAETQAKPAAPPLPQRPAPSRVRPGQQEQRRGFLKTAGALVATPFAAGWTAFTTASIAATLGMARFMMPNVIVEPPSKFKIGLPEDYPLNTVTTKWKSEYAIWITHQLYAGKPVIYALSTVCTHLGCTPNWLEGEQKFKCPCHGSGFYPDGINFEGPAPRPLERYGITLASDGMLEVDKSMKFQEELGQWNDPASFVATG